MRYLEFELEIAKLDQEIAQKCNELLHTKDNLALKTLITSLENEKNEKLKQIYQNLSPWQKVTVARHENRPNIWHYISGITSSFFEISGDKCHGNDASIVCGLGIIDGNSFVICGNNKSGQCKTNFGMAHPEGYRKFLRAVKLANDFSMPLLSFVDIPGAFPGVEAEKRGQAYCIAKSMYDTVNLRVPNISIIVGEGGSGGAIAISLANYVIMLEHSVYSVISPEGCSSILWKNTGYKDVAAIRQKITANDLLDMGIIDHIIPEPVGGAHRDHQYIISKVKEHILAVIHGFVGTDLVEHRKNKFLQMTRQFCLK